MAIKKPYDVDFKHPLFNEWMDISDLPRTLLGGTRAMRLAEKKYLPQDTLEHNQDYNNRLARTTLVNMYRKTVNFLSGQVFSKRVVLDESLPEEILRYQEDSDLLGTSLDTFLKRSFEIGIGEGAYHILVDSNNMDGDFTSKAEEIESGVRTYFRGIKGSSLFGWIDEDGNLSQIRIYESKTKRVDDYGIEIIPQIRVIEPGQWRVFQQIKKSGGWQVVEDGITSLDYIPLVSFIPGERLSIVTGDTPLSDLAELNLDHWQSKSDQKNILHITRAPKMFGRKIDLNVINANPQSAIVSDADNSDLKYVETNGKSIEAGQRDLTEIESKMALYGLQQLIPRSGNMTATEKAITSAESNSSLGTWVSIFESCVRKCFEYVADFEKASDFDPNKISINRDFTSGIFNVEMVNVYLKMVETNVISAKSAFDEIKRKGFVSEELDWLDVVSEMEDEKKRTDSTSLIPFGE